MFVSEYLKFMSVWGC